MDSSSPPYDSFPQFRIDFWGQGSFLHLGHEAQKEFILLILCGSEGDENESWPSFGVQCVWSALHLDI